MTDAQDQILIAGVERTAAQFGRTLGEPAASRIAAFLRLMLRWNERINLTGARSADDLLRDHLPDSFALSGLVPAAARVVDVGSGGGLPGLPFALLRPDVGLTLVEPRAKRVAFLRTAMRELGITAQVVSDRMEALGQRYDVAASRATFPPPEWLARGARLVEPGGRLVFFLNRADETPPLPPGASQETLRYAAGGGERVTVAFTLVPAVAG